LTLSQLTNNNKTKRLKYKNTMQILQLTMIILRCQNNLTDNNNNLDIKMFK